ncbi:MAG: tRNA lysidine(34) synthetase TilS [Waddliaceae bacterium]
MDIVATFLKKHADQSRSFRLALSGGPDSLYLYHQLKNCRINFSVAHVNHRWRKESDEEAETLKQLVESDNIPFHLSTIESGIKSENEARNYRRQFFLKLCKKHNFQAVMTAHHYDDQVETVLKRVFEGAALENLAGMMSVQKACELTLWRPLLSVKKSEILNWLESRKIDAFSDHTNHDLRYTRARLRKIIPELSHQFQKEIAPSFFHIGAEAALLKEYLEEKVSPLLELAIKADWGTFFDFSSVKPHPLELKHLLRMTSKLSRDQLRVALQLIMENAANKKVGNLIIDRSRLFVLHSSLPVDWTVIEEPCDQFEAPTDWRDVWKGKMSVTLPRGAYKVIPINQKDAAPFKKRWNSMKVPAFLYHSAPLIVQNEKIAHEFLTGRQQTTHPPFMKLTLLPKD